MTRDQQAIILIGGGGHACVVGEAARAANMRIVGVIDDYEDSPAVTRLSVAWLTSVESLMTSETRFDHAAAFIAVGSLKLREAIAARLTQLAIDAATIVHPDSTVSPSASIDSGVYIGARAIVNSGARIGSHAILNSACVVEHDCEIGRNTHIAPGAVLAGGVMVGDSTLVGLGARVLPGIRVGSHATVGAGAVVTCDVPDGVTVVGVPAQPVGE